MNLLRYLILILSFYYSGNLYSVVKNKQYSFRSLDINNGLSQNTVHAIIQDKQGFMWFGTKDGLDRYDGYTFRTYNKETGTLGNNFITALYEDSLGDIWIGTDVGVYLYSPQKDTIERFIQKSDLDTSIDHTILMIVGDREGGVWITSQGQGIFYYNCHNKQLLNYRLTPPDREVLHFDNKDVCWIMYNGNLFYSNDKLKSLNPVFPDDDDKPLRHDYIYKIIKGPSNCIYIGTQKGIREVNLTNKTVRSILTTDDMGDDVLVRDIIFNTEYEMWVATESGLYIYNVDTHKTVHLKNINGDPYSISDNAIYSICKDKEGGMWIGSYFGGVNYYPKQYTYFDKIYPHTEKDEMGKRVREFCPDKDGKLWIGTEEKGLFRYDPVTGKINAFKNSRIFRNIHGLCMFGDYLWVGTFSKGLNRIDLKTGAVKHYPNMPGDIFSIYKDTSGELWVGTTIGLMKYKPESDDFYSIPELGGVFIYHIKEDSRKNLWVSTYVDGVYTKNAQTGEWKHYVHNDTDPGSIPSNKVLSIFEDSRNQMWFTTQGEGFCRFEPDSETFMCYSSNIELPNNVIFRIEEDKQNKFWISTNKGLLHFDPETLAFKVYTTGNGLLDNQFNYQSSYKDENGRMYFGSINGFISFDPSGFVDNNYIPPVVITDFTLFNKKVAVGEKDSPLKQNIIFCENLELKSNQNSFSFGAAVLSYQSPEMNTLLHKLEGYDTEWYPMSQGIVSYSNLPYGTYTLMLKGANSDGVWNETIVL